RLAADAKKASAPSGDRAAVDGDDGVVGQQLVELVDDDLRLQGHVGARGLFSEQAVPLLHALLGGFEEGAVLFALHQRRQRDEYAAAIAVERDVGWIAEAEL